MPQTPTTWLGRTLVNPDSTGFQTDQEIIGLSNGNILVVYTDESPVSPGAGRDITGVIYDAEGGVVRPAFQVNSYFIFSGEQRPSIAATGDGGFIMAYADIDENGVSLRAERHDAAGNAVDHVAILTDPGAILLNNPQIAVDQSDNSFFVTYEHHDVADSTIRGRKFDANMDPVGVEAILRNDEDPTNTTSAGDPLGQDTAILTNGTYVTVFEESDITEGLNDIGIEGRISSAAGTNGVSFSVTTANGGYDTDACVAALSDGGFVVVWRESEVTAGVLNNNIKYRVYEANGTVRTDILTAADSPNNHQKPDVIGLEDGTFFIGWEDTTTDRIEGRLYNGATGTGIGDEINIETTDKPFAPEFGTTTDGRILVSYRTLGASDDIQFEILDPRDATITADDGDGQVTGRQTGSTIIGSKVHDKLLGQGGDDTIVFPQSIPGSGNIDTIDGGGGVNTFKITTSIFEYLIDLQAGIFAVGNIASGPIPIGNVRATLTNIQNVTVAGRQDIRGDNGANVLIEAGVGVFDNNFQGLGGGDTILAGSGDDIINGGSGADSMNGQAGDDWFFVDSTSDEVIEGVDLGSDRVLASVSYALSAGAEVELLTTTNTAGTGAINLAGNEFVQTIHGNAGVNTLTGGGGGDTLVGFGGDDRYVVDDIGDVITEGAGQGLNDEVITSISYTLGAAAQIELFTTTNVAGVGAINLTGNGFAQTIEGNAGVNDLNGAGGADTMVGFGGDDRYFVDNVADVVTEGAAGGVSDRVLTSVSYTLGAAAQVELFTTTNTAGAGAINLTGNGFVQTMHGNAGINTLNGGGGADSMTGFAGDDRYFVDDAGDVVVEGAGQGTADRVLASVNYTLAAGTQIELFTTGNTAGTSTLTLTGNEFVQTMHGNAGVNILNGAGGSDTITGFAGVDAFVFNTALGAANVDTITDYTIVDDHFRLENAIFAGLAAGNLAPGAFVVGAAAADASDRIIYNSVSGALSFDADGTGAGASVQFASLTAGLAMTAGEFLVI